MSVGSEIAIKVDGIGKRYILGGASNTNLRESLLNLLSFRKKSKDTFWALRHLEFSVPKGAVLGVIGKNGAGKSTLLKLLSKITKPTEGRIEINGRVASLLEVGTGFHPELTGRENIYLNGTILGMTRNEVKEKIEQIIAFSGVKKFIDTPVKRYSSGMKVRLAFSVAAHLQPEILIIDEVLAVGDYEFQKKCLGKMEEVARGGRTVVFVSHNLAAVKNLCTQAIVLEKGEIVKSGDVADCINFYQNSSTKLVSNKINLLSDDLTRKESLGELKFNELQLLKQPFTFGEEIEMSFSFMSSIQRKYENLIIGVELIDINNNVMIHASNKYLGIKIDHQDDYNEQYSFKIQNNLRPGLYNVTVFVQDNLGIQDWIVEACTIEIAEGSPYVYSNLNEIKGVVFPEYSVHQLKK